MLRMCILAPLHATHSMRTMASYYYAHAPCAQVQAMLEAVWAQQREVWSVSADHARIMLQGPSAALAEGSKGDGRGGAARERAGEGAGATGVCGTGGAGCPPSVCGCALLCMWCCSHAWLRQGSSLLCLCLCRACRVHQTLS